MPTAESRVTTDRASRYLVQIRDHLDELRHRAEHAHADDETTRPPKVQAIDGTDLHAVIVFPFGECTLDASDEALTIRLTATDDGTLHRMQSMLAERITTIGRRDNLTVTW
jgi:hypothetical protein